MCRCNPTAGYVVWSSATFRSMSHSSYIYIYIHPYTYNIHTCIYTYIHARTHCTVVMHSKVGFMVWPSAAFKPVFDSSYVYVYTYTRMYTYTHTHNVQV